MNGRKRRRIALAALLLGLAGCAGHGRHPAARRDNVVVVVIDTLRRDHLATYGYPRDTAPFLGEMARQGTAFDGLTPAPWTKPATAALLTGLHPVHHQTFDRLDRLPAAALTLAERLRGAGYHTVGVSANGWVSSAFGFDRGFDRFLLGDDFKAAALNRRLLLPEVDRLKPPFFLYVHYIDPHLPYGPEVGWDGRPLPAALRARPVTLQEVDATHFVPRSPELLARARDLYDGEIRDVDDALRALIGRLAGRGLMAHTLLVVTADHGEELGDHGRMSHGQTVYQEVLQIPLVIRAPGRILAGRRPGRASLMDVVPTLLDLLGIDGAGDDDLDGVSLAGLLTRGTPPPAADRPFLAHLDFVDGVGVGLLRGRYKLVLAKNPFRKELFDLAVDPGERTNLIGRPEAGAVFPRLAGDLARLYNGYSRVSLERSDANLDDKLARRLASLGYVAGRRKSQPRAIPRRLGPADPFPDGRLGWAPSGVNCVQMGSVESERSLLAGWYAPEGNGRWSAQGASLVLAPPASLWGGARPVLVLDGANYRQAPVKVTLSVDRHRVLESELPAGPIHLVAPLRGVAPEGLDLVEIATDPAFVPARHGMQDQRSLGLFLTEVCLQPGAGH